MRILTKILAAVTLPAVILFIAGCETTQSTNAAKKELNQPPAVSPSASGQSTSADQAVEDLLRKGDGLIVRLSGVPAEDQGTYELRIDENGQISMPYIGSVKAVGLTSAELKIKIEASYRERKIYTNPNVSVVTVERRFVDIYGEVRAPQRIMYTKDLTAYGAIAASGGFTDYADRRRVKLLRGDKVIEFNALDIAKDPSKDVLLQPNDKINVGRSVF